MSLTPLRIMNGRHPVSDQSHQGRQRAVARFLRRHPLTTLVAGVALVALVGYLAWWMSWRSAHVTSKDARIGGSMINIASRFPGWLIKQPVIEGDHIHKGQVLAVLDKRDARLRLAELQARIAAGTARIQQYKTQQNTTHNGNQADLEDARANITAARAGVAQAKHQQELAETDFKRIDKLLNTGVVSQQQWDKMHSTLIQRRDALHHARAQLRAAQAALGKAQAQGGQVAVLGEQINVAQQTRQSLMAQADQVRQELADRTLTSPIDGLVDKTLTDEGDYVQAGQWMMMIHDPKQIWVEANIKETVVGPVRPGDPVRVHIDAYPDMKVTGQVLHVGGTATSEFALLPSPNPSGSFTKIAQRVPVRIVLQKPDPRLKPGLMVEVAIDVSD